MFTLKVPTSKTEYYAVAAFFSKLMSQYVFVVRKLLFYHLTYQRD